MSYKVTMYLIGKLLEILKSNREDLVKVLFLCLLWGLENWNLLHKWGLVETQLLRTVN